MAISRADRAKQFLSFDALKGFQEALRAKEIEYEDKKELSEEEKEKISAQLIELEKGDNIKVKYYFNKYYKTIEGKIKEVNFIRKRIILTDDNIVNFENILKIN